MELLNDLSLGLRAEGLLPLFTQYLDQMQALIFDQIRAPLPFPVDKEYLLMLHLKLRVLEEVRNLIHTDIGSGQLAAEELRRSKDGRE